jgi:hypothetical protein
VETCGHTGTGRVRVGERDGRLRDYWVSVTARGSRGRSRGIVHVPLSDSPSRGNCAHTRLLRAQDHVKRLVSGGHSLNLLFDEAHKSW